MRSFFPKPAPSLVKSFASFFIAFLLGSLPGYALAAEDPASKAANEHEQRLQEEQQRLHDRIRTDRPPADSFLQAPEAADTSGLPAGETCVAVRVIAVQGVEVLDMALVDAVTRQYASRCLTLADINQLVKAISTLYLERGYITSRAFVQPQRIKQGTLDIFVSEGRLERLQSSDGNLTERQLRWAFPVKEGDIVNLRHFEQGIEQLNRLQQNHAELDIKPGTNTGDSVVDIHNLKGSPFHGNASLDNSGSKATGETIASASLSWDNPANSNDNLYATFSEALGGESAATSRSYALLYSIPRGYSLLTLSSNYFEYQEQVQGAATVFTTSGTSSNQSIMFDQTFYRGQYDKLVFNANFTRKESKNYLEDVFLETSSRVLSIADIGVTYSHKLNRGMLHSSAKWYHSMDLFGAKTKLASAENDYQFDKYTLDADLSRGFDFMGQEFSYLGSLYLLYSSQNLLASEGLAIGGRYTVRGIEGSSLAGNRGGYLRNEIALYKNLGLGIQVQPFVGIDYGISNAPEYGRGEINVAGALVGFHLNCMSLSADVTYATALEAPGFLHLDKNAIYAAVHFNW